MRKLGWKPGLTAVAIGAPAHYPALIEEAPIDRLEHAPEGLSLDFVHLFLAARADLIRDLPRLEAQLRTGGVIWVSWPKKTSPLHVDLTEDGVRSAALPLGLVDVKVCAVDEDWSALKLTRRRARRAA